MNRFPKPLELLDLWEKYKLLDEFVYDSHRAGIITVPKGFPTDLTSFRVLGLRARGRVDGPAVIHDYLYAVGACSRLQADLIFLEAMLAASVPCWRARIYFVGVRFRAWKAWNNHRRGRTEGSRFVRLQNKQNSTSVSNHHDYD
jgi:Protein of unknown function (DUF1353)